MIGHCSRACRMHADALQVVQGPPRRSSNTEMRSMKEEGAALGIANESIVQVGERLLPQLTTGRDAHHFA